MIRFAEFGDQLFMSEPVNNIHAREDDNEQQRSPKRTKLEVDIADPVKLEATKVPLLPPSHALLGLPTPEVSSNGTRQILETDVGISEYTGQNVPSVVGIIKQR